MDMACGDATPTLLILSTLVAQHRRGHHSTYYGYTYYGYTYYGSLALHRIYEAIAAGCIPVIIADRLQLPFARRLAWPSFSVRIAEAEALADPLAIVRTVSPPSLPTPSLPTPSLPTPSLLTPSSPSPPAPLAATPPRRQRCLAP